MEQTVQQYDTPPPNYKPNQHATHGFSHRPSPAQIASFIIIGYTIAVYFSCVISIKYNLTLLVLYCISFGILVLSSAQASLTNPTDRVVYYYKWSRHDKKVAFSPEYDKILFCQFCDSYCYANSKHCRTCNRCVDKFDHHCMWFNNCVGKRNYSFFFVSILSTFINSIIFIAHVVLSSIKTDYSNRQQLTKIVIAWVGALMMGIFGFLLFNLIALHFYLIATDQTTYQFLQKRRKEQEEQMKLKQKMQEQHKNSNNKVMPEINQQRHDMPSQQSIANTKLNIGKHEQEEDVKTDQFHNASSPQRKKQHLKIQITNVNKQLIFNEACSVLSRGNEPDQHEQQQEESIIRQNHTSLPNFFKQNKSLKLLLSEIEATSPLKSRKNVSDVIHLQK